MLAGNNIRYRVVAKVAESADVSTITLEYPDGTYPKFMAGQYITIYFPESGTPEGKAYTISSAPSENKFTVTVKAMGDFSNRLCSLMPGDTVIGSLPYGYFYSEASDTPLVLVAGGIGVTPFRSMIIESLAHDLQRPIILFLSSRTQAESIFKTEFNTLASNHPNFTIHYFVTRENKVPENITPARVSGSEIVRRVHDTSQAEFFICGSISFVRDIWRDLVKHGINEEMICTEAFFSH